MKNISILLILSFLSANTIADSRDRISYDSHGENLPDQVTNNVEAQEYRQAVKELIGMESYEKNDLEFFTKSYKGLYLIKKTNRKEPAFRNVIAHTKNVYPWKNGKSFIGALKKYTKQNGCIPKVSSVSHGWRTSTEYGDFHGLSGSKGFNGIYASKATRPKGLAKLGTRTVKEDLQEAIDNGEVKFCGKCVIQFYACNISTLFADTLANVTKCQTVVATGKASPYFQSVETEEEYKKTYSGFHYWKAAAGIWEERGLGQWYRSTPITNEHGDVVDMIKENIGNLYIAL